MQRKEAFHGNEHKGKAFVTQTFCQRQNAEKRNIVFMEKENGLN